MGFLFVHVCYIPLCPFSGELGLVGTNQIKTKTLPLKCVCVSEDANSFIASRDLYTLWYVKSHLPKSSSDCQIKLSCSSRSSVVVIGAQMLPSHVGSVKLNLTAVPGPCKCALCHLTCFRILLHATGWYDLQKPLPQWQLETRRDTSCHASKSCLQHLSCTTSYS